jgi:MFS family permease
MKQVAFFQGIYKDGAKYGRFLVSLALYGAAYGFYRGIQDNYLAQIVNISRFERGIVEFFREIPGLLVVLILSAMYRFSERKVFKIGIAVMLAGLAGLFCVGSGKISVVFFMVIFSFGEHIIMPVKSTISLELAAEGKGGASLGVTGALYHAGNITGFVLVTLLFIAFTSFGVSPQSLLPFKTVFAIAVALMTAALLVALAIKDNGEKVKRQRFYFAKKFTTYYMLEVFYGARKQIFLTFAPYVLILQYGANTQVIALLLGVCALFGTLLNTTIGRIIDKLGYKTVMVGDTLILIVVCFFYGFAHRLFPVNIAYIVVCINFVLDSIISLASMASNVYVREISDSSEELTATISTGISVNHFISIFIALAGGWIWQHVGIEVLFTISAFLGLCNSIYAAAIKTKPKVAQSA